MNAFLNNAWKKIMKQEKEGLTSASGLLALGTPSKKKIIVFSDIESKCMSGSGLKHNFRSIRNNDKLVVSVGVEVSLSHFRWYFWAIK